MKWSQLGENAHVKVMGRWAGGTRKSQPRNKKTGEFKSRSIMPYINGVLIVGFLGFVFTHGGIIEQYQSNHVAHAAVILDDGKEPLTQADIEAKKDAVVKTILDCERAGHTEDDAIITYDNNKAGTLRGKNVWSLGQLQFKVSTIQAYVKMRDGEQITQKEAVLLALDSARASDLAEWIIFETKGGYANWLTCSMKHGIPEKVAAIKALKAGQLAK